MNLQQKAKMPLILKAIPIRMDLKRYYWRKYLYLRERNGAKFAAGVFKTFRQSVMAYVNDVDRLARLDSYLDSCPVRKNGWLRQLFAYADTDPISVIQFLKLYTVESKPVVSVEEAAEGMQAEMRAANPAPTPPLLHEWFRFVRDQRRVENAVRRYFREGVAPVRDQLLRGFILSLAESSEAPSAQEIIRRYRVYRLKVLKTLKPDVTIGKRALDLVQNHLPTYASYKSFWDKDGFYRPPLDAEPGNGFDENPLLTDLRALAALSESSWKPEVDHVVDTLPEALKDFFGEVYEGDCDPPVGHIRFIPKSGTVVRRSIADPNRFLQAGLVPYQKVLRGITSRIPRNCQFDQEKLDVLIHKRLQRSFAGSVDLHQATDWMPLEWFLAIEAEFLLPVLGWTLSSVPFDTYDRATPPPLCASRNLFIRMSRAQWDAEGLPLQWRRGQPLGTLPSFEVLTITHYCVMEALSVSHGLLWSPYALLGDDVVIFDPFVRRGYIGLMQSVGSPLSLHKSYDGRLTEFAGKIHVKNQGYRYSSDISVVQWKSLFDLQRSMGVVIHWGDLPKKIQKKVERYAKACRQPTSPESLYTAMQICAGVPVRLSHMSDDIGRLVTNFYSAPDTDEPKETPRLFFMNVEGHVGAYDHETYVPHVRPKAGWWKKKHRPVSTLSLIHI